MSRLFNAAAIAATLLLSPVVLAQKVSVEEVQTGLDHPWLSGKNATAQG